MVKQQGKFKGLYYLQTDVTLTICSVIMKQDSKWKLKISGNLIKERNENFITRNKRLRFILLVHFKKYLLQYLLKSYFQEQTQLSSVIL